MRTRLGFFITITIAATLTFGQHDKVTVHVPKNPRDFVAYCALWRADGEFRSSIRLSNQLLTSDMDAWITLYMADGTAYELVPVHLAKGAVAAIDISDALAKAPESIRSHLSIVGSAAVRYRYDWQGAVFATMSILNLTRSLEFASPFRFPDAEGSATGTPEAHILQGLWWKRGDAANGFLAIANTTGKPVQVTVRAGGAPDAIETALAPHAMSFRRLPELLVHSPAPDARVGGIEISYAGRFGDVQVAGGLEDPTTGYSRDMPFARQKAHMEPPSPQRYAAAGIMTGQQQASLGFPSEVKFRPFAFFRNITAGARRVQLEAYYMEGFRTVGSLPLPPLTLPPGASAEVPLGNVASAVPHVEAINLAWSYEGHPGDVMAGIGSTDQNGTYVFPVAGEPVGRTGSKMSIYWQVANGFDTMYTIWNPEPTDEDVLVTLRYGNGREVYQMPLHLVPHESAMIDIGELARERRPDFNGKLLPLSPIEGTLLVSGPQSLPEELINVVLAGGIYNPRKATCGLTCEYCPGMTGPCFDPASFWLPTDGTQQGGLCYNNWDGWVYWVTNAADWSSSATGVATVQTYGNSSPGLVTGIGVGNASINAVSRDEIPVNAERVCSMYGEPVCPMGRAGGGGPATVLSIRITSADITQSPAGTIGISLQPAGLSGLLTIYVQYGQGGGNQFAVLTNATRQSGTYNESFNRTSIPINEYTYIQAVWIVEGAPAAVVAQYPYHFKALGVYNNTLYNTPTEQYCTGVIETFTYAIGQCGPVTCSTHNGEGKKGFLDAVDLNGSGYSQSIGYMSNEYQCTNIQYRQVPQPCPQCLSLGALVVGQSVARNTGNLDLPCGATVFVDGMGTRTVQDAGDLAMNQLDHYVGVTGCNRYAGPAGSHSVFRIF